MQYQDVSVWPCSTLHPPARASVSMAFATLADTLRFISIIFDWLVHQSGDSQSRRVIFYRLSLHVVEGYALQVLHLPPNRVHCTFLCPRGANLKVILCTCFLIMNVLYVALFFVFFCHCLLADATAWTRSARVSVTVSQTDHCRRTDAPYCRLIAR